MLLLHQAGSVKIGEVVRYTVTYTPAHDRILPSPSQLHLKIKNTSAIALRAAFVHGPYTLYAASYPSNFHPNQKFENPRRDGVPEFEPYLKAGASFSSELVVPEDIRATAGRADRNGKSPGSEEDVKSVSWIIEVASQVIFSNSAAVHYEIWLGRDEKSLNLGFGNAITGGSVTPAPGQVSDHQQSQGAKDGHHNAQVKGVYSKAIRLKVEDTASLWNTPRMPEWDDAGEDRAKVHSKDKAVESVIVPKEDNPEDPTPKRQKKVHLVVLTHGLHSNLGADMLFLKESIDASAKQAKIDAKLRRAKRRQEQEKSCSAGQSREGQPRGEKVADDGSAKPPSERLEDNIDEDDDDEEEVIVRGFSGNAVRTERGIKYLGKRLAKYVLQMTYPDQPYRPVTKKSAADALSHALKPEQSKPDDGSQVHRNSTIEKEPYHDRELSYKITSISFIAHSLGGLIQMYAIGYIQKHSPEFFNIIKPINFIALASPFLGLSNENPLYVKFALDFGLVGRSGKDLGLTWRAPTLARSGWGAIVGGIGESASKKIEGDIAPESKPLLRILPTGPAHTVLKKFRHRTVYSNVVNDGIVPLRTSCLLFLDWSGLDRVEKARRENGLVGTIAGWGWAEVMGQNSGSPSRHTFSDAGSSDADETGGNTPIRHGHGGDVPQPPPSAIDDDDTQSLKSINHELRRSPVPSSLGDSGDIPSPISPSTKTESPFASLFSLFKPSPSPKPPHNDHPKHTKIYKRSQTIKIGSDSSIPTISAHGSSPGERTKATTGESGHEDFNRLSAPPKTTFFESAGDLLKPPLPSVQWLIDPASRPRTIFHDRVYHPEDIPPPPLKKRPTSSLKLRRRSISTTITEPVPNSTVKHSDSILSSRDYDDTKNTNPDKDPRDVVDGSAMKVEEKIARAYHRDLSWRKVLVRLEPDAHNNMIVRRMFANAYGWPVIKHLCDAHFSDAAVATTRTEDEGNQERAKPSNEHPNDNGGELKDHGKVPIKMLSHSDRTDSENGEAKDEVPALNPAPKPSSLGLALAGKGINMRKPSSDRTVDSESWSERDWEDSEMDSEEEDVQQAKAGPGDAKKGWNWTEAIVGKGATSPKGTHNAEIDKFLERKKSHGGKDAEHGHQLEGDAAVTRVLSGQAARMAVASTAEGRLG